MREEKGEERRDGKVVCLISHYTGVAYSRHHICYACPDPPIGD